MCAVRKKVEVIHPHGESLAPPPPISQTDATQSGEKIPSLVGDDDWGYEDMALKAEEQSRCTPLNEDSRFTPLSEHSVARAKINVGMED